jgi:hypothetical protein
MEQKIQIPAIHDRDLRKILDKYLLSDKIDRGEIRCNLCNKPITWGNLYAIKVVNDSLIIFCDEPNCIEISNN